MHGQQNIKKKNVEFYSKNKYEKLVHLVGFIIRTLISYEDLLPFVGASSVEVFTLLTNFLTKALAKNCTHARYEVLGVVLLGSGFRSLET